MRVKTKILISYIMIGVIIAIVGIAGIEIIKEEMTSYIKEDTEELGIRKMQEIDTTIFRRIEELNQIIIDKDIIEELEKSNKEFEEKNNLQEYLDEIDKEWNNLENKEVQEVVNKISNSTISEELRDHITFLEETNEESVYGEVFITNKYGANIAQSQKTSDFRQNDESWWQNTILNDRDIGELNFDESAEINSIDISIAIKDEKDEVIGVIKGVLDISGIERILKDSINDMNHEDEVSMHMSLIDENNKIIFSTLHETNENHNTIEEEKQNEEVNNETKIAFSERTKIIDETLITKVDSKGHLGYEGKNWILIVEHDLNEILYPVIRVERILLILYLIGVMTSLLVGLYLSDYINSELKSLKDYTKEVGRGNLSTRKIKRKNDEIGEVLEDFEKMKKSLKKYQKKLITLEQEKRKELKREVKLKTKKLNKNIKELEKTRSAMINILEDMDESNKELKKLDNAKSEFLNIVSHELKTPLTAMMAYIDILEDEDQKTQKESIEVIKRNAKNLQRLIGNILEIARIESGKFELTIQKVQLKETIKSTIEEIEILAEKKGIKIIQKLEYTKTIEGDTERIKEIIHNLISNGIKFTEKGTIKVTTKQQKQNIELIIEDTGVGIPKDKLKKLFTKFYQVDTSISRKYGGTGLGLAITKKIVESHGGTINAKSKEGKGTKFTITLPIKQHLNKEKGSK